MNIKKYITERFDFRYNVIQGRPEFKIKNSTKPYRFLDDRIANSILVQAKETGIYTSQSELMILLNSDFVPMYDPITAYMNSLPEWDGEDYISRLAMTVTTTSQDYFVWAFTKWFVAMVACAIHEDITNHCALVLIGEQGCGKTTWIENLVPRELKNYLTSKSINPTNKDSILLLSEKMLINMDELANFNNRQIEAYKELITKSKITERRVYERFSNNFPRRASFAATTNHHSVLPDQTGNRRFLVFEVENIEFDFERNLPQVYAQAVALIKEDFRFYFNREEQRRVETENENYRQVSQEEELIIQYLECPDESKDTQEFEYMNATEIIAYLKSKVRNSNRLNPIIVGKVMTSIGFRTIKKIGLKKYIVNLK